jgi:hypothetical protein
MGKKKKIYEDEHLCKKCKEILTERNLYIIDTYCYKCNQSMKVALVRNYSTLGPEEFTQEELRIASDNSVNIKSNYSNTMEEEYLSNTCNNPDCNVFVGKFFLFKDYLVPADTGYLSYLKFHTGYDCQRCDWEKE